MSDKLTYRDVLVYTLNGILCLTLIGIVFRSSLQVYIFETEIKNSTVILFIAIPVCYLIGHIVLSIDNLIFAQILKKKFRKRLFDSDSCSIRFFHNLLFGYRILGVQDIKWKEEYGSFNDICVRLRKNKQFDFADKVYILSDFFKGLIIIELIVLVLTGIKADWNYFFVSIGLLLLIYLRARKYSHDYVNEILKQSKIIRGTNHQK